MAHQMTFHTSSDTLCIGLSGRIDAANAASVEKDIKAARQEHPGLKTVLDAEDLAYISSAGLRILLRLRKEEPELKVINVSLEVY